MLPFEPVKPVRGGKPLDQLYNTLAADPRWECQAKLNGRRAIWDGKQLWSRQGNLLNNVPGILEILENHFSGYILDGEYMTVTGSHRTEATFWVFDCATWAKEPLEKRREGLAAMLAPWRDSGLVELLPSGVNWGDVAKNNWEGVVFKKKSSPYPMGARGGTTANWVKYRAEWLGTGSDD